MSETNGQPITSRNAFLGVAWPVKEYEIKSLGKVLIRTWSGDDREKYMALLDDESSTTKQHAALAAALSLSDENGEPLFTTDDDSLAKLAGRPMPHLLDIADAAMEFNGLGPKAMEDAEGNSKAASPGSGTDSPDISDAPSEN
jgi:hypothetical protein